MKHIIKNVIIHYKNGSKKIFEAISIDINGVYTGFFTFKNKNKTKFIDNGFVPIEHIDKICSLSNEIDDLIIDFKRNIKEEVEK